MKRRKFKPGDRVQKRGEGPVMMVLNYCLKKSPIVGTYVSDDEVLCVWYTNNRRQTGVFDQRVLTRASVSNGLFCDRTIQADGFSTSFHSRD